MSACVTAHVDTDQIAIPFVHAGRTSAVLSLFTETRARAALRGRRPQHALPFLRRRAPRWASAIWLPRAAHFGTRARGHIFFFVCLFRNSGAPRKTEIEKRARAVYLLQRGGERGLAELACPHGAVVSWPISSHQRGGAGMRERTHTAAEAAQAALAVARTRRGNGIGEIQAPLPSPDTTRGRKINERIQKSREKASSALFPSAHKSKIKRLLGFHE